MIRSSVVACVALFTGSAFAQVDPSVWFGAGPSLFVSSTLYEHRPDGVIQAYALPGTTTDWSIARDAGGNVFFADAGAGVVRRYKSGVGQVAQFAVANGVSRLVANPDGSLWVTNGTALVTRVNASGAILASCMATATPTACVADTAGNLWFTALFDLGNLRVISPSGTESVIVLTPPPATLAPVIAPLADGLVALGDGTVVIRLFDASLQLKGTITAPQAVGSIAAAPCDTLLCDYSGQKKLVRLTRAGEVVATIPTTTLQTLTIFAAAADGTYWATGASSGFTGATVHYDRDGNVMQTFNHGSAAGWSDPAGAQFLNLAGPLVDSDGDTVSNRAETALGFNALDPVSHPNGLSAAITGPAQITVNIASPRHASSPYLVVAAFTPGQGPQLEPPCACPRIPLVADGLLRRSWLMPPLLPGFAGTLNASGTVSTPVTIPPILSGLSVHLSAILDNSDTTTAATTAVAITLP